jgi:hypothetical protein
MASEKTIVAYWLCPAESARAHFAAMILDFAAQFDAPPFEPHVTTYVTSADGEDPNGALIKAVSGFRPLRLSVRGFGSSDNFTKTLFVQFQNDNQVTRLSEALRHASSSKDAYELNPHLSLIYANMDCRTQEELAGSLTLPFTEVVFDSLKAVISPAEITSREDVMAWRTVAEATLPT